MRRIACNFRILFTLIAVLGIFLPSHAFAHIEQGQAIGFVTGLRHPWSGLDHVLAMIAVGLWGAQLGNPALWILPVTFPMVMSLGAFMGLLGIPLPGVEIGIAMSAILLGAMVVGEVRPKMVIAALMVGFFAIFHGHAHGTELPAGQSGMLYSMGFVFATGCFAPRLCKASKHRAVHSVLLLLPGKNPQPPSWFYPFNISPTTSSI